MAKRTRRGQKQCPQCKAWVKGTRAKQCPKCGHQFSGKPVKAAARVPAPPAVALEKPVKAADTVTLDQIRAVALTVQAVGGCGRIYDVLDLVKELGGVKKFRELVEAITATEEDAIPF